MLSKNQVVVLGESFFIFYLSLTVCGKKRPPSYFAVAAWTSNFCCSFYYALDITSQKIKWLHDGGENIWLTKIEKLPLLYLVLDVQTSNFYYSFYNALGLKITKR